METLRGVFPTVPTEALLRVLDVCDQSVAVASAWLVENDWQDLMLEAQEEDMGEVPGPTANIATTNANVTIAAEAAATPAPAQQNQTHDPEPNATNALAPLLARRSTGLYGLNADLDSGDEDEIAENDEEEDEDEDDVYYDSGDEAGFRVGGVPPLVKRVKVSQSEGKTGGDDFWVAFDDQVMTKSMIELLNTTLTKLAHSKVVLLNQPVKEVDEAEAGNKLRSMVSVKEADGGGAADDDVQPPRDTRNRRGITLSCLLNGGSPRAVSHSGEVGELSGSSESLTTSTSDAFTGQKRKRTVPLDSPKRGFFAHFFPIRELDIVWRTVMNAHLFKSRFGDTIEFHTATGGAFVKREFDELMHIESSASSSRAASLGFSPLATLKCCLILPCLADEEEMLRVGRNIHSVLKIQGNLYYRVMEHSQKSSRGDPHVGLPSDDGKMTEERFRQFSRYRIRETTADSKSPRPSNIGVDPYISYQQQTKPSHCLEILEAGKWTFRLAN